MIKHVLAVVSMMAAGIVLGAPAKGGGEPTAEGFPSWTGITPKHHIWGRQLLSNAELRQRITVVVEVDLAKSAEQLETVGTLASCSGLGRLRSVDCSAWSTFKLPRDVMVIFVAHNVKDPKVVADALKGLDQKKDPGKWAISSSSAPIYSNVTFDGAPDNGGKFPFVYVMGYEGLEPVFKGTYGDDTAKAVGKVVSAQKKAQAAKGVEWRPYYGYVAEPAHFKDIEKALSKGKPLEPIMPKLKKGIQSKTPEVAKEAQMLHDALEQTKSDMVFVIQSCYVSAPHVAAYNLGQVLKHWPSTKKVLSTVSDKLKADSAAQPVIKMYAKLAEWANPDFTCKNAGEAKRIVAELNKMKKQVQALTTDKNVKVQNCAWVVDGMLDELISVIPSKVPQK